MATIYEAPFVFGVRVEGDTFTDRREETERLKMNFLYGINTILISPRRMGKTSLVDKVCSLMVDDSIRIARMDAFGCRSEQDFINAFATAVLRATSSKWEEWMKGDILQLPELIAREKGIRIVVCIDEFQQLGEFPDSLTFQKKLRSVWQLQNHVSYCLYGSKKHLMEQMFQNASYPFYRFGDFFYLEKISEADWVAYITHRFKATGKEIASELATEICRVTERYSSYVQQLAWFVWLKTTHTATMEDVQFAINRLLDANEPLFIQQTEDLSAYQMNFLRAIVEGVHSGFTQTEVLNRYRLGTAANVTRLKKSLTAKDLIMSYSPKKLVMSDPILALWLKRRVFHS
ncbi:ATP-binding protein [Parabacteroides distasonis]|nr:ATP-binding protein [Parabacteroides distasonis]